MKKEELIKELGEIKEAILMNDLQFVTAHGNSELHKSCQEKKELLTSRKQEIEQELSKMSSSVERAFIGIETNPFMNFF